MTEMAQAFVSLAISIYPSPSHHRDAGQRQNCCPSILNFHKMLWLILIKNGLYVPRAVQDTDHFNPVLAGAVENQVAANGEFV
jgi:hypothetical protein